MDIDAPVRLQLVHDRFITGQEHRALHRYLDSVGPDTPISDIVDRCRVWESHEERNSRHMARHKPTGEKRPVRKKYTMTHNIYNTPVPHNTDSDESDGDEMLPMGAFWPVPEDEKWTMVERSHGSLRGAKGIDSDRLHNSGDKLDNSGMRCGQLDYLTKRIITVQDRRCC